MVNLISAVSRGGGMAKTLPISEAKMKLGELVASLEAGDEEGIITRNGRLVASGAFLNALNRSAACSSCR
jgi:antitoxin (DNA-binding transcriptional repressor) of toxin-antitoxin stability system